MQTRIESQRWRNTLRTFFVLGIVACGGDFTVGSDGSTSDGDFTVGSDGSTSDFTVGSDGSTSDFTVGSDGSTSDGDFTVGSDGSTSDGSLNEDTLVASSSCADALTTTNSFLPFEGERINFFLDLGAADFEDGTLMLSTRDGQALLIGRDIFADLTNCVNLVESGENGVLVLSAKRFNEGFSCILERESGRVTLAGVDEGLLTQGQLPWSLPAPMRVLATHEGTRVRCSWLHAERGEVFALEGEGQNLDGLHFELNLSGDAIRIEDIALGRR